MIEWYCIAKILIAFYFNYSNEGDRTRIETTYSYCKLFAILVFYIDFSLEGHSVGVTNVYVII